MIAELQAKKEEVTWQALLSDGRCCAVAVSLDELVQGIGAQLNYEWGAIIRSDENCPIYILHGWKTVPET